MLNIIITTFLFILLVTQKILLLNEESLILLCFITFVFIGMKNLGPSFDTSLQVQSKVIQENISISLKNLLSIFEKFRVFNKNFKFNLNKFVEWKNYYKNFVSLLGTLILNYNTYHLSSTYTKKLLFVNKIEQHTLKLLTVILIKKLSSIIKIKYFYNSSVKINHFLNINKILLRECIQLINLRKV